MSMFYTSLLSNMLSLQIVYLRDLPARQLRLEQGCTDMKASGIVAGRVIGPTNLKQGQLCAPKGTGEQCSMALRRRLSLPRRVAKVGKC